MAKPIYQDDGPVPKVRKPRRKKYPRGKHPRPLTSQSRDVKLLRLPYKQLITLTEAAALMGITRSGLQCSYIHNKKYLMPDYIEVVRDNNITIGLRRIGP